MIKKNKELEDKVKAWYKKKTGLDMDFDHPITFNEKIQWLKVYDSTPLKGLLADKYKVHEYITKLLGKDLFIPLLGVWDRFDDIDFNKLPDSFVLKANHGSGWNIVVPDKSKFNIKEAKEKFDKWMSLDFGKIGYELHYSYIKPKIVAEKYLKEDGQVGLTDYRFYCYNGKAKEVIIDKNSGTKQHVRCVFDINFNKKNVKSTWGDGGAIFNKPIHYDEMIEIAETIAKDFVFIRVDFYEIDGTLYLGELTFTPTAGIGRYEPKEWGIECGNMMDLTPIMR